MYPNGIVYEARKGKRTNTKELFFKFIVETDNDLIEEAYKGKALKECRICGTKGDFDTYECKEFLIGLRHNFLYFECSSCETLQIDEYPNDMRSFYNHNQYKYNKPDIKPIPKVAQQDKRMILDVGCGNGQWLCNLASSIGSVNLFGCDDVVLDKDIIYPNGVKLYNKSLYEMTGEYDVIMLNNSINRIINPHEVFKSLKRLLKASNKDISDVPKIQIITQKFPNVAWDIFNIYWHQLNAPRHYYLYSEKSIKQLSRQYGLYVKEAKQIMSSYPIYLSRHYQADSVANIDYGFPNQQEFTNYFNLLSEMSKMVNKHDYVEYTIIHS